MYFFFFYSFLINVSSMIWFLMTSDSTTSDVLQTDKSFISFLFRSRSLLQTSYKLQLKLSLGSFWNFHWNLKNRGRLFVVLLFEAYHSRGYFNFINFYYRTFSLPSTKTPRWMWLSSQMSCTCWWRNLWPINMQENGLRMPRRYVRQWKDLRADYSMWL